MKTVFVIVAAVGGGFLWALGQEIMGANSEFVGAVRWMSFTSGVIMTVIVTRLWKNQPD